MCIIIYIIGVIMLHVEGADFVGPTPSVVTFTAGQSVRDVQCTNVTILDDSVVDGHKNFSIRLTSDIGGVNGSRGGGGAVEIDTNIPAVVINIAIDTDDSKRNEIAKIMLLLL